jgi:hypothetical protein
MLANSRQADLVGSKIMNKLKKVSGQQVNFFGYGGQHMQAEGFENSVEINMDEFCDKLFHTYRKTKTNRESIFFRWNPLNFTNKHYTNKTDQCFDKLMDQELPRKIFQARPDLIMNIDNEYMTFMMMDHIRKFYKNSSVDMP